MPTSTVLMVPSKSRNTDVHGEIDAIHRAKLAVIHSATVCEWLVTPGTRGAIPMSSDDNVKTVTTVYEAFTRGDIPTVLDALTDDVDWASEAASTEVPWWGPRHGKTDVLAFFDPLGGAMELVEFTPLVIVGDGDDVLTVVRYRAKSRTNGKTATWSSTTTGRFRDGKIARATAAPRTRSRRSRVYARADRRRAGSDVVRHRHHRDAGLEQQPGLHLQGPVVVQTVLPPRGHELADHHRHQVGALGLDRLDLLEQRLADLPVGRGDDVERHRHLLLDPLAPRAARRPRASSAMCTARTRSGRSSSATRNASRAPSCSVATGTSAT